MKQKSTKVTKTVRAELTADQKWAVLESWGTGCPRCGGPHKKVTVRRFKNPPVYTTTHDGKRYLVNGWSMCPKLKEPILFVSNLEVRAK